VNCELREDGELGEGVKRKENKIWVIRLGFRSFWT
jgi:hypothetical protein